MNYELMRKTDTSQRIIEYIREKEQATARDLVDLLSISERAVFKQLANLIAEEKLTKIGKPPKVFYLLKEKETRKFNVDKFSPPARKTIEENFMIITPAGERKVGIEGFSFWCQHTKQPIEKMTKIYQETFKKYQSLRKDGLIDGREKMKNTFDIVYLEHLFYLDFYAIEVFGKTKLGQLLLYAKQSQDRILMKELFSDIKPKVNYIINKYHIDGIGFIPPTVKRKVQFMKEMEKNLHPNIRKISIVKAKTEITVPQKTLNNLQDRIENARRTVIVTDSGHYENILLIDDAVGSGATLNETASQIRRKKLCQGKIIGLVITGSLNGFDVISEI